MSRDRVFLYVLGALFGFMIMFGAGAIIVSLIRDPTEVVTLRVVGALASMFSAVVGLILGYLVGRNGNGG